MKKIINCLKEDNPIINKKLKKVSVEEGLEIAKELLEILSDRKDAIGFAIGRSIFAKPLEYFFKNKVSKEVAIRTISNN